MNTLSYSEWFKIITGYAPHAWQSHIGNIPDCTNRLIRIPTGFGKTIGVSGAWIFNRIIRHDTTWPRRLVWMLPMRVLVEQTVHTIQSILQRQNLLWNGKEDHSGKIGVHVLMGGEDATDWRLYPEENAILIGTQDMLLSRALNRGYGAARGRWPMEYALLNTDSLWVMDEVQLMDVGLITSVQLQAFRNAYARGKKNFRPCKTWWMSATLRPEWMDSVDFHEDLETLKNDMLTLPGNDRQGELWGIPKRMEIRTIPTPRGKEGNLAEPILTMHMDATPGQYGRITLAVVNTVDAATAIHKKLLALVQKQEVQPEIELIHSRFRGVERTQWPGRFLAKEHCSPNADRIIVATQVVEAGVDISAINLITELAPWANLIQRFGRCARYGGQGNILVIDRELGEKTLPYQPQELLAAKEALRLLDGKADLATLTTFEEMLETQNQKLLSRLFPYEYIHLLTRREADELFDTSPDLTGADLDISRFIRSGEERDVYVFWINDIPAKDVPPPGLQPIKKALCPVPVYKMKQWPSNKGNKQRAWHWDYLDGQWIPLRRTDAYPGMIICVESKTGGYSTQCGWTGIKPAKKTPPVPVVPNSKKENADIAQDNEADSRQDHWRTIATHCSEVSEELSGILKAMGIADNHLASVLELTTLLHDWGKAHPVFRSCMKNIPEEWDGINLAKAPNWVAPRDFFTQSDTHGERKGFRHELASTLACFELLRSIDPDHPALLGPYHEYFEQGVLERLPEPPRLHAEKDRFSFLADLSADDFNLLVYLICCHHGKIRGTIQSTPHDQDFPVYDSKFEGTGQPVRGIRDGDVLPSCTLMNTNQTPIALPELTLHLDPAYLGLSSRYGPSWTERVHTLVKKYGPFQLAYFETLVRAADIRASQTNEPDIRLLGGTS